MARLALRTEPPAIRKPALDALWSWYLEWSQTARAALDEPRLLRLLGFSP